MKNIIIVLFVVSLFSIISLLSVGNVYGQQNNTIGEDFKTCVLSFDNYHNIFGPDSANLKLSYCYMLYKATGEFPHQMSIEDIANLGSEISRLANQTDLGDMLRGYNHFN